VTREQIHRLLDRALLRDEHDAPARQLDALAADYESGEVSRASLLVLAAEEWRRVGRPAIALERFRQALGPLQLAPSLQ